MAHKMNLNPEPFAMIRSGQKTIELRLNEEKRQKINVGDSIEFNQIETGEKLTAEVIAIHRFDSFAELYQKLPLLKCGFILEFKGIDNYQGEQKEICRYWYER